METPTGELYPLAIISIDSDTQEFRADIGAVLLPPTSIPFIMALLYKSLKKAYLERGQIKPEDVEVLEMEIMKKLEEELTND